MKIYKSKNDRLIAGVCGGLAKAFNLKANYLRIILVGLTLILGLIKGNLVIITPGLYLIAALFLDYDKNEVPKSLFVKIIERLIDSEEQTTNQQVKQKNNGRKQLTDVQERDVKKK